MELFAKKSLGQHFLNSTHVLEQIISAGNIKPNETILEIGPGTGILTAPLLKSGAKVIAIEKDTRSISILHEKFANEIANGQLIVIEGDILDSTVLENGNRNQIATELNAGNFKRAAVELTNGNFALIANIPYYITGAILEKFLEIGPRPSRIVLLVQKEVADRIMARDGKESLLSLSVKVFGTPKMVAKVARGAFTPPPTVDSAILAIENISDKLLAEKGIDAKFFFKVIKAGFAHKRKVLIRNLESAFNPEAIKSAWISAGIDQKVRSEDLTLENWLILAKELVTLSVK